MIAILGQVVFGIILILILFLLIGTFLLLATRIADSILEYFGLSLKVVARAIVDDWDKETEENNERQDRSRSRCYEERVYRKYP